jgi:hypothetical protein
VTLPGGRFSVPCSRGDIRRVYAAQGQTQGSNDVLKDREGDTRLKE